MEEKSPSTQIDEIIQLHGGWKGDAIKNIRALIHDAFPGITEEIKWKTASRPEGLPVWSHHGIVCLIEIWKDNVKLIFFKGAQLNDTDKLFNARLKSSGFRAIELHEGDILEEESLKALILRAVDLNTHAQSS